MQSIEDVYDLDVPEPVALAVWDFLENGRPDHSSDIRTLSLYHGVINISREKGRTK